MAGCIEDDNSLSGICWCTYSPTCSDAMMSSLHCRISVRAVTLRQVGAIVRHEGDARELLGDVRIGAAEAVGEFLAQFGPVRIAHDRRRHGGGPPMMIVVERGQQFLDLRRAETALVVAVIDVARRRTDHHQAFEHSGALMRASTPIIALTEWPTNTASAQPELVADLHDVVGIAVESDAYFAAVVGTPGLIGPRRHGRTAPCGSRSRNAGATKRHIF